jgi:Trk K+ transport system NAD-binding subunit
MNRLILLCGLGRIGIRVLEYLQTAGLSVVVIDTQCKPDDPRLKGARLVVGDCRRREVLEAAGVAGAGGVLVLTRDDLLNVTTALVVRAINKDVRIVLRMFNQNLLARLGKAVHNVFALSTSLLTAPMLAMTAVTGQELGTFRIEGLAGERRDVAEIVIGPSSRLRGRSIATVAGSRDALALAHFKVDGSQTYLLDLDAQARLESGDRLVLCGDPRSLAPLINASEDGEESDRHWAGPLRRLGRIVRRTWAEIDIGVKVCTAALIGVLALSTVVLYVWVRHYQLHQAFLRTVSIMATGAGLHEEDFQDSPTVMIYVSVLRLAGAALVAAFTAILTNYLIRARLGGVFEIRRVPDSGHIIVVGLSTIGFRLVEELKGLGEQVVVIEQDPTNRFVLTARKLGAAVIIGDAGVIEVLRQANAGTAQAVIATTNNDMTNLEVGLLARELNPQERVVLLLEEAQFARLLRENANIHLALSVPALAAPAFVAGLFGDRVAGVFFLGSRLHAVIDLIINENDPFVGHAVRAMAFDYRLQPLAVIRADGTVPDVLASARVGAGDRLVAVIALTDLERLFRRQPCSAAYAVEVTAFPLPAHDWLVGLARALRQTSVEEAGQLVAGLPFLLAGSLTRGQAEDLLAQLNRERVSARICCLEGAATPG